MSEHELLYQFRIDADAAAALEKLPVCIEESNPVPERKRGALRYEIRDLWRALTMERSQRNVDYLGEPAFFSAYLRYFLPWNLVRLTALLTDMQLPLSPNATIVDIGAGPLTFAIALYCAKPELRKQPLTILCADRAPRIMEAGKLILETLAAKHQGELPPWQIILRRARFGEPLPEKANLLVAANVFNEFFWHHEGILGDEAAELYRKITRYCAPDGSMLIVEPGEPRSGSLISALRAAAILSGDTVRAPCPHTHACPMPGIFRIGQEHLIGAPNRARDHQRPSATATQRERVVGRPSLLRVRMPTIRAKYPWCHFSVNASAAPRWLRRLSEEAGLAKEKLSFSFLLTAVDSHSSKIGPSAPHSPPREKSAQSGTAVYRVISDPISLPFGLAGRYACGSGGYTLIRSSASGHALPESGSLVAIAGDAHAPRADLSTEKGPPEYDQKSGAILVSY